MNGSREPLSIGDIFDSLEGWKVRNVDCVLEAMLSSCPKLTGVSFAAWSRLTGEQLVHFVQEFKCLQRIDLSSSTVSSHQIHRTGVWYLKKKSISIRQCDLRAVCEAIEIMGSRLTHLTLTRKVSCIVYKIITALSVGSNFCPSRTNPIGHFPIHRNTVRTWCSSICHASNPT